MPKSEADSKPSSPNMDDGHRNEDAWTISTARDASLADSGAPNDCLEAAPEQVRQ